MSPNLVGITIGEIRITDFRFVVNPEHEPGTFDYLTVEVEEGGVKRQCLCQVVDITASTPAATGDIPIEALQRLKATVTTKVHLLGTAKMIGYIKNGEIILPKHVARPASDVFEAEDAFLADFFEVPADDALEVGHLMNRPTFSAQIDVRGFNRHVAILGITGCGKSNLTGVILEELLEKGATVVVLDPHGDYSEMSSLESGDPYELTDRIDVFSRIGRQFTVRFADFSVDDICEMAGIHQNMTRLIGATQHAIQHIREQNNDDDYSFTSQELYNQLNVMADEDIAGAVGARARVRRLLPYEVLGTANTPLQDILRPQHITVIDLSGISDRTLQMIASLLLERIYEARINFIRSYEGEQFEFPVFTILEEAQKFAPTSSSARSLGILERITAEGRKFGVFITLVTQRPYKVAENVLSMCNSQIIMRILNSRDQTTVKETSEALAEDLLKDLPGLNVGEAIVVGSIVPAPMALKARRRRTRHAGADIDVHQALQDAREEAKRQAPQDLKDDLGSLV